MTLSNIGHQPLVGRSPTPATFPDGSIHDLSADNTYLPSESPPQPQIPTMDVHPSWASSIQTPESTGCLSDIPEPEPGNSASPHLSENHLGGQFDYPSLSSLHLLTANGTLAPSYNWQQQSTDTITCTSVVPPFIMPTNPDKFSSGSTQSVTYSMLRTVPSMNLDGVINLCPECYSSPFPSVWTVELLGCVNCQRWFSRAPAMQSEIFTDPSPAPAPAIPLDRLRSTTTTITTSTTCPFQARSRKGKSPPTRVRRSVKPQSSAAQELTCCPGNTNFPCQHASCSPPPNVALLSRKFEENEKWQRARRKAVASFSYEKCGFYKLPIEVVWMIVDLYPRLDYSYMRSIRAEPSIYNHRFEVLRNLIGVSKSFRKTFYNTYWETFEIALTYQRRRVPEPGSLELGTEPARFVSRLNELQGLRKMFYDHKQTAACIRTLTFRIDRDADIMQLFVDCLLSLPSLHTLEIAPTFLPLVTLFSNAFKHRPQLPSVRRLIAPAGAHPILQCLPNLEELVCTRGEKPHILISKVFQAYDTVNTAATFKSFELIGTNWTDMVGKELLRCFPNIQKVAMRRPSVAHLEKLVSLTEISELELWILNDADAALVKRLKAKATEILRKSKPRIVCNCDDAMDVDPVERGTGTDVKQEVEKTKSAACGCSPPKRVFRLKHLIRKHGQWGTPFWGGDGVEEIEVSPLED